MLHHAHRGGLDRNHLAVKHVLTKSGLFVLDTSMVPGGCADLFVWHPGHRRFCWTELKRPGPPSARTLSESEAAWHKRAMRVGLPAIVAQGSQEVIDFLERRETR